ncbi:hypothetical protein M3194_15705 [Paenibacillus glycanilyticus]|nr:hypothetical protein [Paenibacillus glycanilyticus]MCM3628789.1 hypothetical protein [Paenibacillus glycanilyticus]
MATQIAATPVLRGKDAQNLLNSLNHKSSKKSIENGKKLVEYFKGVERRK